MISIGLSIRRFCMRQSFTIPRRAAFATNSTFLEEANGRLQVKSARNTAINTPSECMDMNWLWDGS